MSTKTTLKHHRDEQSGAWFHLYRDCFDDDNKFVYLAMGGVAFEAANSADLTAGTGPGSVAVRIPSDWAAKLGMIANKEKT